MAGDEDEERRGSEGIVLPSPIQRRDYRLRMFWVLFERSIGNFLLASIKLVQNGLDNSEDLTLINAFGIDLNFDSEPKHR